MWRGKLLLSISIFQFAAYFLDRNGMIIRICMAILYSFILLSCTNETIKSRDCGKQNGKSLPADSKFSVSPALYINKTN